MRSLTIDYNRFLLQWLPSRLRQPKMIAYMRACLLQVVRLYVSFNAYADGVNYQLAHNSQVCYMEAMLNDYFDAIDRRIYIDDAPYNTSSDLIYDESVDMPHLIYDEMINLPFMLYEENFGGSDSIDFIVFVPTGLLYNAIQMRALINQYKLAGKRYIIQLY